MPRSGVLYRFRVYYPIHAPIAQLVEQIPLKDKVVGSNPTGGTYLFHI